MLKQAQWIKAIKTIVNISLLILSALAIVKTLFIGFDIDEAYAVAQSYRLATGDKMFMHMWEPHQMSAFGSTLFILPYLGIVGSTTGIVLYLRIIGTLLHLALGYWLYRTAKNHFGSTCGLLLILAHVNFLPKWIALPEFELMQYWGVLIAFLSLLSWVHKNQSRYLWWAGCGLFLALTTYPTMILLYPVYLIGIVVLSKESRKEKFLACAKFTAAPAVLGTAFLLYLRSYMTITEFKEYLSKIFMDKSHSVSVAFRFGEYGKELGDLFGDLFACVPEALLATVVVICIAFIIRKTKAKATESNTNIKKGIGKYGYFFLLYLTFILLRKHIWGSLLEDQNQFYLYFRYVFIVLMGIILAFSTKHSPKSYFYFAILPGLIGVLASALLTNMSLEISFARVYIGVIGSLFILCELLQNKWKDEYWIKVLSYVIGVLFVGGLLVSKLVLVRVTGCIPVTVRMPLGQITAGPAKGIYVHKDLATQFNENIPLIIEHVSDEDTLLYFGCENLYYLLTNATIASPSVQGTTVFDEVFLEYYKLHPDRVPNVVIIDKNYEKNPDYPYEYINHVVLDWIEDEFGDAECIETNNLLIYTK